MRRNAIALLVTTAFGFGIPYLAAYCGLLSHRAFGTPLARESILQWLYIQHALQLAIGLALIAVLKRVVPADYGLHLPRGRTYVAAALGWGVFFGVLMTVVDYAPQLASGAKPHLDYPFTTANVIGQLFFEGIYVGPTEEIPFRALLVTFLATTMPGRLSVGRFEMNQAGIVVALIFALLHASSFSLRDWPEALGQQVYAFVLGVLYAYWLEKSGSVLAPIIGHNAGDLVEEMMVMVWAES